MCIRDRLKDVLKTIFATIVKFLVAEGFVSLDVACTDGTKMEDVYKRQANRNKLTELASGSKDDKANNWFVGHPIDCIYDYEKVGLWNSCLLYTSRCV